MEGSLRLQVNGLDGYAMKSAWRALPCLVSGTDIECNSQCLKPCATSRPRIISRRLNNHHGATKHSVLLESRCANRPRSASGSGARKTMCIIDMGSRMAVFSKFALQDRDPTKHHARCLAQQAANLKLLRLAEACLQTTHRSTPTCFERISRGGGRICASLPHLRGPE